MITRQLPAEGCTCGADANSDVEPQREEGLEVIRVPARKWPPGPLPKSVRRLVLFVRAAPDDWASEARTAARKYAEDTNVDLVWTTSAPIISTRLGRFFQRKLDVPWVAELRDSVWRSSVMVVRGRGTRARLLRRRAMQLARPLREADAVVHVTGKEAQADAAFVPQPSRVIPSAFDEMAWGRSTLGRCARRTARTQLPCCSLAMCTPTGLGYSDLLRRCRKVFLKPARDRQADPGDLHGTDLRRIRCGSGAARSV